MKTNTIILITIIICTTIIFYTNFQNNYIFAIIQGDSMKPTFSEHEIVLINKVFPPENLVKGDIAVVNISDKNMEFEKIAHTVIQNNVEEQWFATKGDNNSYYSEEEGFDGYFEYERFEGKVIVNTNILSFFLIKGKGGENN